METQIEMWNDSPAGKLETVLLSTLHSRLADLSFATTMFVLHYHLTLARLVSKLHIITIIIK